MIRATFAVAAMTIAACAGAETSFQQSCSTSRDPRVEVYNRSGSIEIIGWDQEKVEVTGKLDDRVTRIDFDCSGDSVEISVVAPKWARAHLVLHVPRGSRLRLETVSANVEVEAITGEGIDIETVSGNVRIESGVEDIKVESISGAIAIENDGDEVGIENVSGSIRVKGTIGNLCIETISGSVHVDAEVDEIEAESVSGSLNIHARDVEEAELQSISGSVNFKGWLTDDGELEIEVLSGAVVVEFTRDVFGEYELTTFSGAFHCELEPLGAVESGKRALEFDYGDGDAEIRIESFSGSITVR